MQVKLLRTIQEKRVRKVGATQEDPVDVRVICATHQNLGALVAAGRFRQDLFYRLNVIELVMPPLRECREDIPEISHAILARLGAQAGGTAARLSPEAAEALARYDFPGNIRELENTIERAALLSDGRFIEADDLRLGEATSGGDAGGAAVVKLPPTGIALEEIERQALVEALRMSNWVQKDAAELLHISPRVMNYKIKVLGIELPRSRRAQVAEAVGSV